MPVTFADAAQKILTLSRKNAGPEELVASAIKTLEEVEEPSQKPLRAFLKSLGIDIEAQAREAQREARRLQTEAERAKAQEALAGKAQEWHGRVLATLAKAREALKEPTKEAVAIVDEMAAVGVSVKLVLGPTISPGKGEAGALVDYPGFKLENIKLRSPRVSAGKSQGWGGGNRGARGDFQGTGVTAGQYFSHHATSGERATAEALSKAERNSYVWRIAYRHRRAELKALTPA